MSIEQINWEKITSQNKDQEDINNIEPQNNDQDKNQVNDKEQIEKQDDFEKFIAEEYEPYFGKISEKQKQELKENKEQQETVHFLIKEVFPYFKLTLNDEKKGVEEILNNKEIESENIRNVNISSYKNVRNHLLTDFNIYTIKGLTSEKLYVSERAKVRILAFAEGLKNLEADEQETIKWWKASGEDGVEEFKRLEPLVLEAVEKIDNLSPKELVALENQLATFFVPSMLSEFFSKYETYMDSGKRVYEGSLSKVIGKEKDDKYKYKLTKEEFFEGLKKEMEKLQKTGCFLSINTGGRAGIQTLISILEAGQIKPRTELSFEEGNEHVGRRATNDNPELERYLGFKPEEHVLYACFIGGLEEEFRQGGAPQMGDIFFLIKPEKVKNRSICFIGDTSYLGHSGGNPEQQFSLEHAPIEKALVNLKLFLEKEYSAIDKESPGVKRLPPGSYIETHIVGSIPLEDIDSINLRINEESFMIKDNQINIHNVAKIILPLIKKQYPQLADKVKIH